MTDRFFTNAIPAAGSVTAVLRIPVDVPAGGSQFITPLQIEQYAEPIIIAATEAALLSLRNPTCKYSANSSTTGFTATASEIAVFCNVATIPGTVVLDLTGALAAGANVQLPTVLVLTTVLGFPFDGQSYLLRIINNSSAAFNWTVTTNTGWTLLGTMTVAQNTFREFLVTIVSAAGQTATLQNVGSGTN